MPFLSAFRSLVSAVITSSITRPRRLPAMAVVLASMALSGNLIFAQTAQFTSSSNSSYIKSPLGTGVVSPFGVAVDAGGNIYIADQGNGGGGDAAGAVYKETYADGGYTQSTIGSGLSNPTGVAVDTGGNVYILDHGSGNVYKETYAGGSYTQSMVRSGFTSAVGLAVDGSGNLYIPNGSLMAPALYKETYASGSYTQSAVGSGFSIPMGIAVDAGGNIYVTDEGNSRVFKETYTGGNYIQSVVDANLSSPAAVAVDGSGNLYVADANAQTVYKETYANGSYTQSVMISGLTDPTGVAVDASGHVSVADAGAAGAGGGVSRLTPSSGVSLNSVPVGTTSATVSLKFTITGDGVLGAPKVLTMGAPNLDFADAGTGTCTTNGTSHSYSAGDTCTVDATFTPKYAGSRMGAVELVDSSGALIATANVYGTGTGPQVVFNPGTTSSALGGGFASPESVSVDGSGNVYVADTYNNAVKEIPAGCTSSSCVTTLGGGFNEPEGVSVDGSGNVYVADASNNAVKEIPAGCASSSCVTTLGGGFNDPWGVSVDGSGNVYVADTYNNAVKEIPAGCASSSCVTTLGGGFAYPDRVAVDGSGNVYVADAMNRSVYEIHRTDAPSLSFAKTAVGSTSSNSPQTVTVQNIGNTALTLLAPVLTNPSFNLGSSASCADSLQAGAVCTLPVSFTPQTTGSAAGSLVLTDDNLNAATTQTISLSGSSAAGLTITAADVTRPYGAANPEFTGSVTGAAPGDTFTESFTTTATASSSPGIYSITPSVAGANLANYGVTVKGGMLTITPAAVNVSVSLAHYTGPASEGSPMGPGGTLTVTVASSTVGTPTGTVTFYSGKTNPGTTKLGMATLTSGQASYAYTPPAASGDLYITAVYSGDPDFQTGTGTIPVHPFELTFDTSTGIQTGPINIGPGGFAAVNIGVGPAAGSAGLTSITRVSASATSASGTSNISVTVDPSSYPAGSPGGTSVITIKSNSGNTSALSRRSTGGIAMALLLLPLAGLRRVRRKLGGLGLVTVLLMLASVGAVSGCGGSSSPPNSSSTPLQKYTVTVKVSDAQSSYSFPLIVEAP